MNFLLADDHEIVRRGLIQILLQEFPGAEIQEVATSHDAIKMVKKKIWDVVILDISMPGRDGIETLKQMRADGISFPILILSMYDQEHYAIRALSAGASGYINKGCPTKELILAIHKVLSGRRYISSAVAELLAGKYLGETSAVAKHRFLSDREMQVLHGIAGGKSLAEMAGENALSVSTISTYRTRILEKLHLRNNSEIIRYAIDNGLS